MQVRAMHDCASQHSQPSHAWRRFRGRGLRVCVGASVHPWPVLLTIMSLCIICWCSPWPRPLLSSCSAIFAIALPHPKRPLPVQLLIPAELAHDTVDALGEVGQLQFKDLNTSKSAFQRTYANQVRGPDDCSRCCEPSRCPCIAGVMNVERRDGVLLQQQAPMKCCVGGRSSGWMRWLASCASSATRHVQT